MLSGENTSFETKVHQATVSSCGLPYIVVHRTILTLHSCRSSLLTMACCQDIISLLCHSFCGVNLESGVLPHPALQIGRYYRTAANSSANDFDHLWCSSSVVHPQWSFSHGLYDIALCFLNDSSRFPPIQLATGGCDAIHRSCLLTA